MIRRCRAALLRIAGTFGITRSGDIDAELASLLQFHIDENLRAGMTPADARRQACLELGGTAQVKETWRDRARIPFIDQLATDLRFGARMLVKERRVACAAVAVIALGIGANTAVFSIVNGLLLKGVPIDRPDRIVVLDTEDTTGRDLLVSLQDFDDWRRAMTTTSQMALVFSPGLAIAKPGDPPVQYAGSYMSASGFAMAGRAAALGRTFGPDDDRVGASPVAVLGDEVWKAQFGADPSIVGRTIDVNGVPTTVVGVMPDGFEFPRGQSVWIPLAQLPNALRQRGRGSRFFFAFARLGDGVRIDGARAELGTAAARLAAQYPDTNRNTRATVTPYLEFAVDPQVRTLSWLLFGAVGFVLLVVCSNVANLLLARYTQRTREVALRMSLGAGRWRIVRQLLTESTLLSLVGGALGLALAAAIVDWMNDVRIAGRPSWAVFTIDGRAMVFVTAICVLTGVLFGLAPALQVARGCESDALKEAGRSNTGARRARRTAAALIAAQLMLTFVLLSGAGLLTRSFINLYRMDLGFQPAHIVTGHIVLSSRRYPTFDRITDFLERVDERLNSADGVAAASTATGLPLSGSDVRELAIEGRPDEPDHPPASVMTLSTGTRYFDVLGVQLLRGRALGEGDGAAGHESAVVNAPFVTKFFGDEDPIGKRIRLTDTSRPGSPAPWATIVGVAPAIRQRPVQPSSSPDPVVYIPNVQNATHRLGTEIIVRAEGSPSAIASELRREIFAIDPDLALSSIITMDDKLTQVEWPSRVAGTLLAAAALLALVLAAVGLYGVTAYSIAQRMREIGVRLALGARAGDIARLVSHGVAPQVAVGLCGGVAGALVAGRLIGSVLIETNPADPLVLGLMAAVLVLVCAVASFVPMRRALKIDPASVLRSE